jgi:hypothetical protein
MPLPPPTPEQLTPGTLLRHYKGGLYRVEGSCRIEATLQTGVLYRACQEDEAVLWLRPLPEFSDWVNTADGKVPRFAWVQNR